MQTWIFSNPPAIIARGVAGGPQEGQGPFGHIFDRLYEDNYAGCDSFEKAEQAILLSACQAVLEKASLKAEDVDVFLAGDLMNQIISSSFVARKLAIPYLGLFGACSTAIEALALGAVLISAGSAQKVLAASSSHNATAEKQFRFPNEYGCQKPAYAQFTVTAAGAAVLAPEGSSLCITSATIGKVEDLGVSDPQNMGAAMAPDDVLLGQ